MCRLDKMKGLSGHITSLEQDVMQVARSKPVAPPAPVPQVGVAVIVVRGDNILIGRRRGSHGSGMPIPNRQ